MVTVSGAPGYEDFEAEQIMIVQSIDGRMMVALGDPGTKEIFLISAEYCEGLEW